MIAFRRISHRLLASTTRRRSQALAIGLLVAALGCDRNETLVVATATTSTTESTGRGWHERVLLATPACVDCALQRREVITITADSSGQLLPRLPWTLADSKGRFLVAARGSNTVLVFDSSGQFLRSMGRKGRGPGELLSVGPMALSAGDSVFVAADGRRINVYAPTGEYIRQTTLQFANLACLSSTSNEFATLSDGRLLIGSGVVARDQPDEPISLADVSGQRLSGFGLPNTSTVGSLSCRAIVVDPGADAIWAAEPFGYRLEELRRSADGSYRTVRQLGVRSPWFREGADPFMTPEQLAESLSDTEVVIEQASLSTRPSRLSRPPSAALRNLQFDSAGRLWLAWRIAAPRWDTVTLRYPLAGEMTLSDELDDVLWHTVLDVIDTRSEELLVRDTFPFHGQLAAPGILVHPRYSSTGGVEMEVHRLRLARQQ